MLLKKQTVWLLTMLSLVVVLSVYYLTSPEKTEETATTEQQLNNNENENAAVMDDKSDSESEPATESDTKDESQTDSSADPKTDSNEATVKITSGDEEFEALRIQIDEERSKLNEELTNKVGNTNLSTDEINKAYEAMEQLSEAKVEENILEGMIVSMNYDAALVRVDGNDVKVTVKAEDHSPADANKIIRLVRGEIEDANDIFVDFQVKK